MKKNMNEENDLEGGQNFPPHRALQVVAVRLPNVGRCALSYFLTPQVLLGRQIRQSISIDFLISFRL